MHNAAHCEASEQKMWPTSATKFKPKIDRALILSSFDFSQQQKTSNLINECKNRTKNDRVMFVRRSHAKVAVGLFWVESW